MSDYENVLELPNIVDKVARVVNWELLESHDSSKYKFVVVVCAKCKEQVIKSLPKENNTSVGKKEIKYEVYTKQEKIDNEQVKINIQDITSDTQLIEINKKLKEHNITRMFFISETDMYGKKSCLEFFSKKLYLHCEYGDSLTVNVKKEKDELIVDTITSQSYPGAMCTLGASALFYPFTKEIKTIVFNKIVNPLECSCGIINSSSKEEEK